MLCYWLHFLNISLPPSWPAAWISNPQITLKCFTVTKWFTVLQSSLQHSFECRKFSFSALVLKSNTFQNCVDFLVDQTQGRHALAVKKTFHWFILNHFFYLQKKSLQYTETLMVWHQLLSNDRGQPSDNLITQSSHLLPNVWFDNMCESRTRSDSSTGSKLKSVTKFSQKSKF